MYGKCVICQERDGIILSKLGQPYCLTCISDLSPEKERLDTALLIFCSECGFFSKIIKEHEVHVIFGSSIRCKNCSKTERFPKEIKDFLRNRN